VSVPVTQTDHSIGITLVVISAITFSTAGLFTKGVSAAAWDVIFWRGVFSAAFTVAWILYQHRFRENFVRMGPSGLAVAVVGALGTAAFIAAFKMTTIANVSLIYAVAPLVAALLAWIWIREKATLRVVLGSIGAIIGVAIIVSGSLGRVNLKGDALALFMAGAMALLMVIYRKYPKTPGAGPAALSSLLLLPVAWVLGDPLGLPMFEIVVLSGFGLVFAIASVTLAEGAKRVPSGQTALLSTLEMPLAPFLAFVVLSEVPPTQTWIGGTVILIAVLLTAREQQLA
jgi:drug/metabolite transporter (DMT)-like permease